MIAAIAAYLTWLPPWAVAVVVFVLILLAAHLAQIMALWILEKRSTHWKPMLRRVFRDTQTIMRVAAVVLAAAIAIPIVPLPARTAEVVQKVLGAAFVVLVGWILMVAANITIDRYIGSFNLQASDNLLARKAVTQARVFKRAMNVLIVLLTAAFALMTFDSVRQYGVSLFASAGVAGIVAGLAAQPLLGNLLAGLQLAVTQPVRLEDAVIIEGEFGWIEEIRSSYVVVRLWDWRRLIVPLTYFFQKPFQNWTRSGSALLAYAMIYLDYSVPVEVLRSKLEEIVKATPLWDGNIVRLQVTDTNERNMQLRALFSVRNASAASDLKCIVREKLIEFIQEEYPDSLPRDRQENITVNNLPAVHPHKRAMQSVY